jgi:hypothetical protein
MVAVNFVTVQLTKLQLWQKAKRENVICRARLGLTRVSACSAEIFEQ